MCIVYSISYSIHVCIRSTIALFVTAFDKNHRSKTICSSIYWKEKAISKECGSATSRRFHGDLEHVQELKE
jgi:hypothetical protein